MFYSEHELFDIWAPADSPWAPWAKPVLFTQDRLHLNTVARSTDELRASSPLTNVWRASSPPRQAVVVDLPGFTTMQAAAQLVLAGYRPVPLFNTTESSATVNALVNVDDILAALDPVADIIREANLAPSAPPAFLLDSSRDPREPNAITDAGRFDNRWLVFPQDFPSANFLKAHGIERVLLYTATVAQPAEDLAHVLLRWQEAGLPVFCSLLSDPPNIRAQSITVESRPRIVRGFAACWCY